MIYYVSENCNYIDYNTLKEKTKKSRTFLNRFLFEVEVRKITYKNRLLFNFDDVLNSAEIKRYFQ